MRLLKLVAHDFRNLAHVEFEPGPRFTVLEGDNGQGKTALLEAVYVLASLKSFRAQRTDELIRHGTEEASLFGVVEATDLQRQVELTLGPRGRRIRIDGKAARSLADSLGQLTVVLFAPEDLAITKAGPGNRRRFIDRATFNRFPRSLEATRRYETALEHRNRLLREGGANALLDAFDEQLSLAAASVLAGRLETMAELQPAFSSAVDEITGAAHTATVAYAPSTPSTLEELRAHFAAKRPEDRRRGTTTTGPHVDDLEVTLDGHPARTTASQGQHRMLVLALKVAEIRTLTAATGHSPLLLLDDVSSELDARRNEDLMRFLGGPAFGGKVIITTTDRRHIQVEGDVRTLRVVRGALLPFATPSATP